jgi:hypothetical protein
MRMEEDGIYGDADVGFAADGQPLTGVQRAARLVGAVGQIADAAEEVRASPLELLFLCDPYSSSEITPN